MMLWASINLMAQEKVMSRKMFFEDTTVLSVTVKTNLKTLLGQAKTPNYQKATLSWKTQDGKMQGTNPIRIRLRGNFRREQCGLASLMVDFRDEEKKSNLKNLKEMKWVAPCSNGIQEEQFVIKEFLLYKIYNLITEKSFKVRLLHITFEDELGKVKGYTKYGFAIEPLGDVKDRLNGIEDNKKQVMQMQTNYNHTTLVAIFQYMIGNTDWAVPNYHNIKLIIPKDSPNVRPYIIPYDFDFAGAVNAPYAVPHESWPITEVTQRHYMGFPRTFEEVKVVTNMLQQKKSEIIQVIEKSDLLLSYHKKEMLKFLSDFFYILESDKRIKDTFVDGARKN